MKRAFIALLLITASPIVTACTVDQTGQVQSAGTKAEIAANDIYTAASRAGMVLVNNGLMDKAKYKALDAQAYAILLKIRVGSATLQELVAVTALLSGGTK